MSYHVFKANTPEAHGSFRVFWQEAHCDEHPNGSVSCHECAMTAGWYWYACFPGCLPDGEASGPFATEQEAIDDANEG